MSTSANQSSTSVNQRKPIFNKRQPVAINLQPMSTNLQPTSTSINQRQPASTNLNRWKKCLRWFLFGYRLWKDLILFGLWLVYVWLKIGFCQPIWFSWNKYKPNKDLWNLSTSVNQTKTNVNTFSMSLDWLTLVDVGLCWLTLVENWLTLVEDWLTLVDVGWRLVYAGWRWLTIGCYWLTLVEDWLTLVEDWFTLVEDWVALVYAGWRLVYACWRWFLSTNRQTCVHFRGKSQRSRPILISHNICDESPYMYIIGTLFIHFNKISRFSRELLEIQACSKLSWLVQVWFQIG